MRLSALSCLRVCPRRYQGPSSTVDFFQECFRSSRGRPMALFLSCAHIFVIKADSTRIRDFDYIYDGTENPLVKQEIDGYNILMVFSGFLTCFKYWDGSSTAERLFLKSAV